MCKTQQKRAFLHKKQAGFALFGTEVAQNESFLGLKWEASDFFNGLLEFADGELQSDEEPSHSIQAATVTLLEDRFGALAGMELEKPDKEMCHYISAGTVTPLEMQTDELGTGDGSYTNNRITQTSVEAKSTRSQALPASFETFEAVVKHLNDLQGVKARVRERTLSIAYVPLTKPKSARQWSYLESDLQKRRDVAIADIVMENRTFSLVEFQWREKESFKLAIALSQDGALVNDDQMRIILLAMARKAGVWENITQFPDGICLATLKHTWPTADACGKAVLLKIEAHFHR